MEKEITVSKDQYQQGIDNIKLWLEFLNAEKSASYKRIDSIDVRSNMILVFVAGLIAGLCVLFGNVYDSDNVANIYFIVTMSLCFATILSIACGISPYKTVAVDLNIFNKIEPLQKQQYEYLYICSEIRKMEIDSLRMIARRKMIILYISFFLMMCTLSFVIVFIVSIMR